MDAILAQLKSLTNLIPQELFGIPTLYIGLSLLVLVLLIWGIRKSKRATPKRELHDLLPEDVNKDDFDEEDEETTEEDGFMPSNISTEEEVSKKTEDKVKKKTAPVEKVIEETAPPVVEKVAVERKKRKPTRDGRKITKADFSDFSGRRLLIAEDNLINQKVINGVLNESGIDVVMADDGQFVMDILEKDSDFEIILMDAHMPRVDGFEATRKIRANPKYDHIAVVALSGDTAVDDVRHMNEAGMEAHLEKPLKMDSLYDVMSVYYTMQDTKEETPIVPPKVDELEIAVDIDDLPCLDYDSGLEICGNDELMYKELLKEFFNGYKNSSKRMHEALVQKDFSKAQAILIDVKGTASNLGAVQFITITEHFLEAISNENKAAYPALFKEYQTYLLALLKSIQAAFKA